MNDDQSRIQNTRESFTGKSLTDSQFTESLALADIIATNIRNTGSFKEKLDDYAHAFARAERFDAMRGEAIIRDIFKARYGLSMNQMRKGLLEREAEIKDSVTEQAITHAREIEPLIRDDKTMAFYQAYDKQAAKMAKSFGITRSGAKAMMKEAYRKIEGRELYETGKALEEKYHLPAREAEREQRQMARTR